MKKISWVNVAGGVSLGIFIFTATAVGYKYRPNTNLKLPPTSEPMQIVQIQHSKNLKDVIQEMQPKIDPSAAEKIAKTVEKYSTKYEFPQELIIAMIKQESTFNPMAVSSSKCVGLMQINPTAHPEKLKELGIKNGQIFHIDNNIHLGCMILKEYYDSTGTISGALSKYLGAANNTYLITILSTYADLTIKNNKS